LLGIDSLVLFPEIWRETGRVPRGLALRSLFDIPWVRIMLHEMGIVEGRRDNAIGLLEEEQLVVTYPGGARDSIKGSHERYQLKWAERRGFARVAIETGSPVVPVGGVGPDEAFPFHTQDGLIPFPFLGDSSYRLPFFVPLARPVPFTFRMGRPIEPPSMDDLRREASGEPKWDSVEDVPDELIDPFVAECRQGLEEVLEALKAERTSDAEWLPAVIDRFGAED
jgi:1-acyl-sn-glycerol-3-phosphate acyltransferase